ncbi:related to STRIATIN [Pseudozyma flocculosa]|nr:related to STRIATIN [Pseudozyma flocculosa]
MGGMQGNQGGEGGQGMFISNSGSMMLGGGGGGNGGLPGGQPGSGGLGVGVGAGNNGQGNGANGVPAQETGNSVAPAEYTLPGILHFLQSEWRRYERDRNEWEIERAEMRARIALLEGERRGVENLKTDLMRRVKMLEYALRQERSKYLSSSSASASTSQPAVAKNPLLQGLEKSTSASGRSSPARSEDMPGPMDGGTLHLARGTGTLSSLSYNPSTIGAGTINGSTFGSTGTGTIGGSNLAAQLSRASSGAKFPQSRAKSRDYLKQCLQEISYLTSASTLNPLPDRGVAASANAAGGAQAQGTQQPRPRMTMLENVPATAPAYQEVQDRPASGSPRRGAGTGAASGGMGTQKGGKIGRSPLYASEPVPEESAEDETADEAGGEAESSKNDVDPLGAVSGGSIVARDALTDEAGSARGDATDAAAEGSTAHNSDDSQQAPDSGSGEHDETAMSSSSSQGSDSSDSAGSYQSCGSRGSSNDSMTDPERDDDGEQVTAIFKPGGRDWEKLKEAGLRGRERREEERKRQQQSDDSAIVSEAQAQLALTTERVNQLMSRSGRNVGATADKHEEDELANLSFNPEDEEAAKAAAADAAADSQMWKSKKVLRSHLDAVRAVAFDQSNLSLISASDDNTIKFWKLDPQSINQPSGKAGADSDPLVTFRGHSAAVTCLAVSHHQRRIYSGSIDSSVRVWQLPDSNVEAYPPYDKSVELGCLVGHTQPVWDLALLPDKSDDEAYLATASADGTIKIWATQQTDSGRAPAELRLSWDYFGVDPPSDVSKERENLEKTGGLPVPTSVDMCRSDLRLCAVAYSNSVVKLFEVETGKQVRQLKSDQTYDNTLSTQINKLVTHPTLPLVITAHEDRYIRMFDLDSSECTLSMIAHLDAVTSLDIDASGLTLVSGGHDCSVRFWDIAGGSLSPREGPNSSGSGAAPATGSADEVVSNGTTAVCRQEITSHRRKAAEGVLAVKYHPTAPYFASAGADGVIRIYG